MRDIESFPEPGQAPLSPKRRQFLKGKALGTCPGCGDNVCMNEEQYTTTQGVHWHLPCMDQVLEATPRMVDAFGTVGTYFAEAGTYLSDGRIEQARQCIEDLGEKLVVITAGFPRSNREGTTPLETADDQSNDAPYPEGA